MRPDVYIHVRLGWTDEGCRSAFKGLLGDCLERMHAIKKRKNASYVALMGFRNLEAACVSGAQC